MHEVSVRICEDTPFHLYTPRNRVRHNATHHGARHYPDPAAVGTATADRPRLPNEKLCLEP